MLLILFTVLVPYQAQAALGLAEPQRDCSVDLRLMYTFMDDKFKMKDEIKQLKATLGELQDRLSIMEKKGNTSIFFIKIMLGNIECDSSVVER